MRMLTASSTLSINSILSSWGQHYLTINAEKNRKSHQEGQELGETRFGLPKKKEVMQI